MVYRKEYPAPPLDEREVLRYAGVRGEAPAETRSLLRDCRRIVADVLTYAVCYAEFPCYVRENEINLSFAAVTSQSLAKALSGCHAVLVFAATVGLGMDRLIAKHTHISPAEAVMLQAIGTERVEALCDAFCAEQCAAYAEVGKALCARFSPGYGDLPLSLQRELFAALDCAKQIGVSLGENLLMTPQKSVTAIVGVRQK